MARDVIKALEVIELTGKTATITPANNNTGLTITNPGTGEAQFIDQNGNGYGLKIDDEGTTAGAFKVDVDALTSGYAFDLRTDSTSTNSGGKLIHLEDTFSSSNRTNLHLTHAGDGPNVILEQSKDVEIIDLSGCTDGGSTNTTVAESIKVKMPGGGTGYINLYT